MTQVQVYSNNLSLYYLFSKWLFVTFKFGFIGFILLYLFQQIQKHIKIYIDKINTLEGKLREINEKYYKLKRQFTLNIEENKKFSNEFSLQMLKRVRILEDQHFINNELIQNKITESNNTINSELCKLNSQINNYVLIGYKILNGSNQIIPVIESSTASNIFKDTPLVDGIPYCDCFIVNQLKYFKNIKEIDIMKVTNKMFIFNNVDLNDLFIGNSELQFLAEYYISNIQNMISDDNPNHIIFMSSLFTNHPGTGRLNLFHRYIDHNKPSCDFNMYVKNGVRKLHDELKKFDIKLIMPDELRDFVFK